MAIKGRHIAPETKYNMHPSSLLTIDTPVFHEDCLIIFKTTMFDTYDVQML